MKISIRNETLQLTELGVRNPVCSLIRSKDGISLYRVESEGKKLILKVFENREDAREIDNYLMLSKLEIPTLPLLGYTKNAILLPDAEASDEYRLGKESDLSDPGVAKAISCEAAEAFIQEYGDGISREQKKADAFLAPLVTLVNACRYDAFPSWAMASLEELKNGDILRYLKEWLSEGGGALTCGRIVV